MTWFRMHNDKMKARDNSSSSYSEKGREPRGMKGMPVAARDQSGWLFKEGTEACPETTAWKGGEMAIMVSGFGLGCLGGG